MKVLNLTNKETSDIMFEVSKYPDGQQNVSIDLKTPAPRLSVWGVDWAKGGVEIKSRFNNFLDLELIICTVKSLRNLGVKEIHLYTPYFMGARSDRKFSTGGNNYLKDVICPIINSLNFETVTVLDPHSHVLEACLNNFKSINNKSLVEFALKDLRFKNNWELMTSAILVSPDAGASHKIYKLAEQIGYKGDVITCSKERDTDGKLTKTIVPKLDLSKDIIIIDDVFDYGRTFTNIAKEIFNQAMSGPPAKGKLYLIVTHSIQGLGLIQAFDHFDCIYSTNSYKDQVFHEEYKDKFKQFNVF